MCGIAGILHPDPDVRSVVTAMTAAIAHRGPDEEGYYRGENIAMGQRRLSIIDLATGRQPISNEDDTLILICNGEIYNSPALRDGLIERGHRFKTGSDVEVILHLYEEMEERCVEKLRGMFAFALWDIPRRRLLLARDHIGQKPLFYHHGENSFVFGSEIKAVLASRQVAPSIDVEGMWHYMSMRYPPGGHTFFQSIQKLAAGTTLVLENGQATLRRFWDIDFTRKHSGSFDTIVEGLDEVITDSVRSHLLSDVRVGAFLSGGIDSSTVTAVMAGVSDDTVPVFSIGVKEQSFNELPYARMVVERYGLEAHERVVESDLIHLIPTMIHHMDEPSDPFGVGVYLASGLARETVKVVLGGDGGDESFAGYDRYAGQRLADFYSVIPGWMRRKVMPRLIGMIPESFQYNTIAQKARWMNDMSFYGRGERYGRSLSFLRFNHEAKQSLFSTGARESIGEPESEARILEFFDAANVNELVDRMLYTDLMTRMPDHLLAIGDRMTMAHSLENRSPLVDPKVIEYAAAIPASMKLKGRRLKHVLKAVAARHLPRELIYRRKQGFSFPIAIWMRTELRGFMEELFRQSRFVELGIFERDEIQRLLSEHMNGVRDHNYRLWILLNLELWYRMYFEDQAMDDMRELTDRLMKAA